MNISDLLDNLSDLIPLFIFLFWVIIAILGSFFKKRNQPGTSTSSRTQSSSQSSAPSGRNISDDLRRSLEDIFGVPSEGGDVEYEEEIHKAAGSAQEQPVTAYDENRSRPKRIVPSASMVETEVKTAIGSQPALSGDVLIKAVIWSEILLPPLSLRDNPARI